LLSLSLVHGANPADRGGYFTFCQSFLFTEWSVALSGALVGAGGATAYYNGVDVSGTVRSLLTGGQLRDLPGWQSSGGNGRELDALYKLV
jgi:hypothetical protein